MFVLLLVLIFATYALSNPGTQINLPKFLNDFGQVMGSEQAWMTSQGTSAEGLYVMGGALPLFCSYTFVKLIIQTYLDWSGYFFLGVRFLGTKMWVGSFCVVSFLLLLLFFIWTLDKNYNLLKVGNKALKFY